MEIKPAKFRKVRKLVTERVSDVVYGCDECRKEIDHNDHDVEYLEFTIFNNSEDGSETERREFCSWKCVVKNLRKVESDYFVSLPFLKYDTKRKGQTAKDFLELLK